jgi:cytoskeletal protein CcmA (bactofilin family)
MWKIQKDDDKPGAPPSPMPVSAPPRQEVRTVDNKPSESYRPSSAAHIGKSVSVKGQLSGSEDLFLDGEVEGSIDLTGHTLTVGPSGRVRAQISAKTVVIHGNVTGNVRGSDKVELKNTAVLAGDIVTKRIAIDDGAFFKGGIDVQKEGAAQEPKPAAVTTAPTGPGTAAPGTPNAGNASGKTDQPAMAEKK